jgi:protocatechuate 4,5-dioxygenase beta chain
MLGLGLASSHAPAMFEQPDLWPKIYSAIPEYTKQSQPHSAVLETPEIIQEYRRRIDRAFETLQKQVISYRPDAVVIVGDDQRQLFDARFNPTFYIFTGEKAWGLTGTNYRPSNLREKFEIPCHAELAQHIHEKLVDRGFDLASGTVFQPLSRPEQGMPHMVSYIFPKISPRYELPVIPLFINEYYAPLPTAERCYQLGVAVGEILSSRSERVAIYASGGLSHDPNGPRAGWIDEPLDRWVLDRLERNEGEALKNLFCFDSDTLRGGTGEVRAWICVAGAMQRSARILDYIPIHHAKAGIGFAYWPVINRSGD